MKRHNTIARVAALTAFLCTVCVASTAAADAPQKRVYALVVANNGSVDEGVEPLRFADDDGARFHEIFTSFADETTLLTTLDADSQKVFTGLAAKTREPTRANLKSTVERLAITLEEDREAGHETEVYLVFTGHGNVDETGEGYLSLADGKLRRSDLYREVIRPLDADFTHLVIDACHAYFMVRSRGGWSDDRSGETLDDELQAFMERRKPGNALQRVGVILSTSGTAEVHEWNRYRGGVFSHQLRSGLLGAADADGDGAVNYREIEAYLVAANAAVANPKARIRVFAEPPAQDRALPVIRMDDFQRASFLEIPQGVGGRYHVEDDRGLRYADMNVATSASTRLALLDRKERRYFLRTDTAQAEIPSGEAVVKSPALAFARTERQSRGSVEEAFRTSLFATPYGPAFVAGFAAGREANVEASTPSPQTSRQERSWHLAADFTLGSSIGIDDHSATQLQAGVAATFDGPIGSRLGLFTEYGNSADAVATIHRVAFGFEAAWRAALTSELGLMPRLRAGPQLVFFDAETDGIFADPVGLRSEAAIVLGWRFDDAVEVNILGGLGLDLVTRAGTERNVEELYWTPFAGVGLTY